MFIVSWGGTQFKVYLPAAAGTTTQPAESMELPIGNGELILVVMTKRQFVNSQTS